eukprot:5254873-Pyramimonas_sp.AAC.1
MAARRSDVDLDVSSDNVSHVPSASTTLTHWEVGARPKLSRHQSWIAHHHIHERDLKPFGPT